MPFGLQVSLDPAKTVLDGDPASPTERGTAPPLFGPCLWWPNGRPSQQLHHLHAADKFGHIVCEKKQVKVLKHVVSVYISSLGY